MMLKLLICVSVLIAATLGATPELDAGREPIRKWGDKVKLLATIDKPRIEKSSDDQHYRVRLPVKFSLSNKGEETLLFVKNATQIVGFRSARSEADLLEGTYLADSITPPGFVRKDIIGLEFSPEVSQRIPVGKALEWEDEYWFSISANDSGLSRSLSLKEIRENDELWFELIVAFYPMNAQPEEGTRLRTKWKMFGHLLLESVSSNPIKIDTRNLRPQ